MKSQAYFEKIHKHIEENLLAANDSIRIAVAWFTDVKLFKILCNKAKEGIVIELLIARHDINFDSSINYNDLKDSGGKLYWIGDNGQYAPLMHNKFCIIDNKVLLFGSYNWTQRAKSNHESITVIEEDDNLILDFNQEFDKIKNKYYNIDTTIDWQKVMIRLDTLLNAIKLEDEEDIKYQVTKINGLIPKDNNELKTVDVHKILENCKKKSYSNAITLISSFTKEYRQLIVFTDAEIPALKLEVRMLEYQVSCLEDEKTEIEKQINRYKIEYNLNLGELIKEILYLKRELAKHEFENDKEKEDEFEEAKKDFEDFNNAYEDNLKEPKPQNLDEEQLKELKQNYRKATKFCHPDKVTEEQKEQAQKVFNELKEAYDTNNLTKVNSILNDLEKGIFKSQGETVSEKDKLITIKNELESKRNKIEVDIVQLKESKTFTVLTTIDNFDNHFEELENKFKTVLEILVSKVKKHGE
jgi:hypothetical protein